MQKHTHIAAGFFSLALLGGYGAGANATVNASATANAQVRSSSTVSAGIYASSSLRAAGGDSLVEKIVARADQEIDRRITVLNALSARIDGAARLSADTKASITADLQAAVDALTTLKAKIEAETDLTTLRTDVQSITRSYRIFALVMPKAAILATTDRINTLVDSMTVIRAKLDTRISAAESAGADVSTAQTALADIDAKIADAKVQSAAAVSLVADLSVDNGDQATFTANRQALINARTKVQAARKDLETARADMGAIVSALQSMHVNATSSATTSASSSDE